MKAYTVSGQSKWFVLGTWAGAVAITFLEVFQSPESKIHSPVIDDTIVLSRFVLYIPLAVLVTLPFVAWLSFRAWQKNIEVKTPWAAPLCFGIVYFPFMYAAMHGLGTTIAVSHEAGIWTVFFVLLIGMPLAFAETCIRLRSKE